MIARFVYISCLSLLFLIQLLVVYKKYSSRAALVVFILNMAGICLGGLLFPFYGNLAVSTILASFLIFNLLIICVPKRWTVLPGTALYSRPYLQRCILLILSIIITFGAIEWVAYALTEHKIISYYSTMQIQVIKGTEDWRIFHITADVIHEPDPVLFWRPIQRPPYNSQGFKGPEVAVPKPRNVFRIICYGDSNTRGFPEDSWPKKLQEVLNRKSCSEESRYEVLNAGVAGYSSYQGLLRFRQEVAKYEPDLIFVSFGWNDLPAAVGAPDKYFKPPHPVFVFLERILLKYRFYLSLKYYLGKIQSPYKFTVRSQARVSLEDYVHNLNEFSNTAKNYGVKIVLLTRPHKREAVGLDLEEMRVSPWRVWRMRVPVYNEELLKFAKDKGILAVDVERIFEDRPDLFSGEAHFTIEGQKKMARILRNELMKNNYLPSGMAKNQPE